MVCTWKAIRDRGGPIPPQVDAAEWALWDAYWRRTDVQDVAWTNRQNRASQSDTAGRAVHHLGRRSTVTDYYQSVRIYVFLQSSITCMYEVSAALLLVDDKLLTRSGLIQVARGEVTSKYAIFKKAKQKGGVWTDCRASSIAVCLCCLKFIFVHYYKLFLKNSN